MSLPPARTARLEAMSPTAAVHMASRPRRPSSTPCPVGPLQRRLSPALSLQLLLPPVVRVLISLLEPSPPDIYGMVPVAFRQTDPEEALGDPAIAAATLEFLAPRLGDIAAVLDVPGAIPEPTAVAGALPQPWGMLPPPLGLHRAMVGALAAAIVRRGDAAARAAITSSGIVPRLLSLFRAYPLNNLLHNEVLALVRAALGSQDEAFERYLVGDCALLEWLASLPETFEARPLREGAPRRSLRVGYIGHIGQMAAAVAAREGESRVLREACSVSATWQVFMDGRMEEQRQREDVHAWRCGRPGPSSPPESEGAHLGDIKALEVGPGRYGMDDDSSSDSSSDEGEAEAGLSRMQGMQALHIMG